jgi:fumarate hydratase class II
MDPFPPDGTIQDGMRLESDSMGKVWVPGDRYWGAQTQRSLLHFSIGEDLIPKAIIIALAVIKKAAAAANRELGILPDEKADAIIRAADEVIEGKLDGNFPLHVWMTGSGSQCNMNVNEVIANRAIELSGGVMGARSPIHPNDHVNMSQSTNDVFPTAMHIAAAVEVRDRLIPCVKGLRDGFDEKAKDWAGIVKIGRTHMMDAVPMTLGQEFSGYAAQLDDDLARVEAALPGIYRLAIGGTAVGSGLNAPEGFSRASVREIAKITRIPFFEPAPNKFAVQGAHDAMVMMSAVLRTIAVSLYKIANDIRILASGPRAGLQELVLPANEPGSSIMPGKTNPTQCEALAMAAVQVMGYDAAVGFAGAGGYLEMNVYKPLIAFNVIQSIRLISDGSRNFMDFLVKGMRPDTEQIALHLNRSLMFATALAPVIGYDKTSQIVHLAHDRNMTLREAALELGYVSGEEFDRLVDPARMARPRS